MGLHCLSRCAASSPQMWCARKPFAPSPRRGCARSRIRYNDDKLLAAFLTALLLIDPPPLLAFFWSPSDEQREWLMAHNITGSHEITSTLAGHSAAERGRQLQNCAPN